MSQHVRVLFPVSAVKLLNSDFFEAGLIQAAQVNAVTIRIGTRNVEGFDAAGFTKHVFSFAGIKGICGEIVCTLQQFEAGFGYYQMQITGA